MQALHYLGDLPGCAAGISSGSQKKKNRIILKGLVSAVLGPRQLGVPTRGGSEISVHSVRTVSHSTETSVLLKVHFKNAFNSHRRDTMLRQANEHAPEVSRMVAQTNSTLMLIFFGTTRIQFRTGCQQEYVFSRALICLVVESILESFLSEVAVTYLNDSTISSQNP